jgi:S1-C subfamily serine protease
MKKKLINLIAAATLLAGTGTACVPMQHVPVNNYNHPQYSEQKVTLDDLISSSYCLLSQREYQDSAGNTFNAGGYGSSFAYREVDGFSYLITNQHVVGELEQNLNGTIYNRDKVDIKIIDSKFDNNKDDDIPLEIVFESEELDLAILRTDQKLNFLPEKNLNLNSDLEFGEEIYLIGYPLAMFPSVTEGIVANPGLYPFHYEFEDKVNGLTVPNSARKVLDLSANPGNSGGPLFVKKDGQLYWAGIISAYLIHNAGGPFYQENSGLAIAMDSKIIKEIADYVIMNVDECVKECKM